MPIEVEDKFVLQNHRKIESALLSDLKKYKPTIYKIKQAYIGTEGRIRLRTKTHHNGKKLSEPVTQYFFTYKRKLKTQKGSLELEMRISKNDFNLAWNEERSVSLTKTRIVINSRHNESWEIDFFKDRGDTYFVLAECELPSHKHTHKMMPDIVKNNLLYVVPDNDPRFKNRVLSNPDKVRSLLQGLSTEYINGTCISANAPVSLPSLLP